MTGHSSAHHLSLPFIPSPQLLPSQRSSSWSAEESVTVHGSRMERLGRYYHHRSPRSTLRRTVDLNQIITSTSSSFDSTSVSAEISPINRGSRVPVARSIRSAASAHDDGGMVEFPCTVPAPAPGAYESPVFSVAGTCHPVVRLPKMQLLTQTRWYTGLWVTYFVVASICEYWVTEPVGFTAALVPLLLWWLCELSRVDRQMLWILCKQFQWHYLFWNAVLFTVFSVWSQVELVSPYRAVLDGLLVCSLQIICSLTDATVKFSTVTKCCYITLIILHAIRVVLFNAFPATTYYSDVAICFFYCSDSRSMAINSILNLCIFFVRDLFSCFQALYHRIPESYNILNTQIDCRLDARQMENGHVDYTEGNIELQPIENDALTTDLLQVYSNPYMYQKEVLGFRPLIPIAWMNRLMHSWVYRVIFCIYVIGYVVAVLNFHLIDEWWQALLGVIGVVSFWVTFMATADVDLFIRLVYTYEWWFLMASLALQVCFAIWSQTYMSISFLVANYIPVAISWGTIFTFDAFPSLTWWFRTLITFLIALFNMWTIAKDRLSMSDLQPRPVCIPYCTTTGRLALALETSLTFFTLRYTYKSARYRNRFIVLSNPLPKLEEVPGLTARVTSIR